MKTKILAAILAVTLTTVPITETVSWHKGRYYAQCCVVTKVSHDVVTVENCNGFRYTFRSCEDDCFLFETQGKAERCCEVMEEGNENCRYYIYEV